MPTPSDIEHMRIFCQNARNMMVANNHKYNNGRTFHAYFPKDWDSVFTYLNENLLRLDSLMSGEKIVIDDIQEKFDDLINYVQLGYIHTMNTLGVEFKIAELDANGEPVPEYDTVERIVDKTPDEQRLIGIRHPRWNGNRSQFKVNTKEKNKQERN